MLAPACTVESSSACTQTHDVTEEEVTAWESNRCRYCGPIITGSREGRLLQSDATTEARELLTELLEIAYSGRKTQEEVLVLLGAQISKTAVISVEVRVLLYVRTSTS